MAGRPAARAARWRACRSASVIGLAPMVLRGMVCSEALRHGTGRAGCGGSGAVLEAPALVAGLEDVAVVGEAVEQGGGHLGVAEDARPFGEGEIGGDEDRGTLVETADQVKEHLPAAQREGQISQLVE